MRTKSILYAAMNLPIRALLRSPLHGIASGSLCILHHRGRRSGKAYEIPLSYTRDGSLVRLLSSHNTRWWMNLLDGPTPVELEIAGRRHAGVARVQTRDGEAFREGIRAFLTALPRDARVYGIGLDRNRRPLESDLERAAGHVVLIEVELQA
jgi:hypothetical protein